MPLMHRYLPFHMQDSGQYSINTEEASRLQLKLSIKHADSDIMKKMTEQACRNQQDNCYEVENSARPFLLFFSALWLNLCNNSDQTLFSDALTFARSLGSC